MTKFGAAENEMERLTAKFAQRTPTEHSLFKFLSWQIFVITTIYYNRKKSAKTLNRKLKIIP